MIIEILAPTNYTILFLGIMKKKPIEELVHDYWDSWDYFADIMMKKPISKNLFTFSGGVQFSRHFRLF